MIVFGTCQHRMFLSVDLSAVFLIMRQSIVSFPLPGMSHLRSVPHTAPRTQMQAGLLLLEVMGN